jgi:hypothetical protein
MPILLTDFARTMGVTLGRISRQLAGADKVRRRHTRANFASSMGATEEQVNMQATVPMRIDSAGTKVEDEAGTGVSDSLGG